MQTGGPSCPLHLGTLDSPDYWTDDALMAAVRPLSATELHRMALGMQHRQERRDQFDEAVVRADDSNICKSKLSINNYLTVSQLLVTTKELA